MYSPHAWRLVRANRESGLELGAGLGMKSIGKPGAGKPHARFDEGALRMYVLGTRSSRVRPGVNKRESQGNKVTAESVLYST